MVSAIHVKLTLSHDKCVTVSARDGLPNTPTFVQCFCGAMLELMLLLGKHHLLHHHYMLGLKILLSNVHMKSTVLTHAGLSLTVLSHLVQLMPLPI